MKMNKTFILLFIIIFNSCSHNDELNLLNANDFGLLNAKTGEERYWALYNAHYKAAQEGKSVDYSGIDGKISISIPSDAKSIPLGPYNDFNGVTIEVENNEKELFLFEMTNKVDTIEIKQSILDGGDFSSVPELSKGIVLLLLNDNNPWTNRDGYGYTHIRQDVLLLNNGKAQNKAVMPWSNAKTTKPICTYVKVDDKQKVIKNLNFERTSNCTKRTYITTVDYQNNVLLDNIKLTTPSSDTMYGDIAIHVTNSTNVTLKDITINGTYSLHNTWGYGINLVNLWNTELIRISADGEWGVIGNRNINTVVMDSCNVNRFDIHCYGRDVKMMNSTFYDMQNCFTSVYGIVSYDRCIFKNCFPEVTRYDYNCYVPFTLSMKDCTMDFKGYEPRFTKNAICVMGYVDSEINSREELLEKAWPNVYIDGLKVISPEWCKDLYVFSVYDTNPVGVIHNIKDVKITKLDMNDNINIKLCNQDVNFAQPVNFEVSKVR